jgi:branched-chain amino acid transport system ATP-binding protein
MTDPQSNAVLELHDVNTFYGPSHILFDVSMNIGDAESVAILGRNGAGKTTTLRSIMGLTPPRSGTIRFRGEEIHGLESNEIRSKGIAWVPEDRRIFPGLTVEEHLDIAASAGDHRGPDFAYDLFPRLANRRNQAAATMSGGEQQMLAISRALVGPKTDVLLLDEPSEGLAPSIIETVKEIVQSLREDEDLTLILVEQNPEMALDLTDRAYVMSKGEIQHEAASEEIREDEEILEQYLGAK